jgi:beta-lactamase class A
MRFLPAVLFLLTLMCCASKEEAVKSGLTELLSREEGTFALAFKDIQTGKEILIQEHELFHAASTMKTPVAAEVYRQVANGQLSLSDSIMIKNEFKSIADGSVYSLRVEDDSEQSLYSKVGQKLPLSEIVYDMIIVSSNLATNIIIELVGAENVTKMMRDLGAKNIQILRGVEDTKAFEKGLNNQVTAYDLMLLFEKIAKDEMVSKEASRDLTQILLDQRFNEIIPALLPKDVKVAHKTGSITGVRHDSGIVILPDGRKYVLVLLSKDLKDPEAGIRLMAKASELVYQYERSL